MVKSFVEVNCYGDDIIVTDVNERMLQLIETGVVKLYVYMKLFPFSKVQNAHQLMKTSGYIAKVILIPNEILMAGKEEDEIIRLFADKVLIEY